MEGLSQSCLLTALIQYTSAIQKDRVIKPRAPRLYPLQPEELLCLPQDEHREVAGWQEEPEQAQARAQNENQNGKEEAIWSRGPRTPVYIVGPAAGRAGQVCEKIDFSGLLDASVQVEVQVQCPVPSASPVTVTVPFAVPGPHSTQFHSPVPFPLPSHIPAGEFQACSSVRCTVGEKTRVFAEIDIKVKIRGYIEGSV